MDTEELKKRLGAECMAQDPRSRKSPKAFEPCTVVGVEYHASDGGAGIIHECFVYNVKMKRKSVSNTWQGKQEYNRCFKVTSNYVIFNN